MVNPMLRSRSEAVQQTRQGGDRMRALRDGAPGLGDGLSPRKTMAVNQWMEESLREAVGVEYLPHDAVRPIIPPSRSLSTQLKIEHYADGDDTQDSEDDRDKGRHPLRRTMRKAGSDAKSEGKVSSKHSSNQVDRESTTSSSSGPGRVAHGYDGPMGDDDERQSSHRGVRSKEWSGNANGSVGEHPARPSTAAGPRRSSRLGGEERFPPKSPLRSMVSGGVDPDFPPSRSTAAAPYRRQLSRQGADSPGSSHGGTSRPGSRTFELESQDGRRHSPGGAEEKGSSVRVIRSASLMEDDDGSVDGSRKEGARKGDRASSLRSAEASVARPRTAEGRHPLIGRCSSQSDSQTGDIQSVLNGRAREDGATGDIDSSGQARRGRERRRVRREGEGL